MATCGRSFSLCWQIKNAQRLLSLRQPIPKQRLFLNGSNSWQSLSTTAKRPVREIQIKTDGTVTTIKGIYVEEPENARVIKTEAPSEKICPVCPHRLNLDIKYTDVLILSQFVSPDGTMLPQKATQLCLKAHNRIEKLVGKAMQAGLMGDLQPNGALQGRLKWRKYNCYFED